MVKIQELLRFAKVVHLAGPLNKVPTEVRVPRGFDNFEGLPEGAVAILQTAPPVHLFDVVIRRAASAHVAAVVFLIGGDVESDANLVPPSFLGSTGRVTADRLGVPVFAAQEDLGRLVIALHRAITGDADAALRQVQNAAAALVEAAGDPDAVMRICATFLGDGVEQRAAIGAEVGAAAHGPDGEFRLAVPAGGVHPEAVRVILDLAVLAATHGVGGDDHLRVRSRILVQLLSASPDGLEHLADRAIAAGLPVNGWHLAIRLVPEALAPSVRDRFLDVMVPQVLTAARRAFRGVGSSDSEWTAAVVDDALVLVGSRLSAPIPGERRTIEARVSTMLSRLEERHGQAGLRLGIGSSHRGTAGIRTSAREARAALLSSPGRAVVSHDAVGLDRMLLEWYASEVAGEAVTELLSPVIAMGGVRAEALLTTVQAYLDHGNSRSRAAEALHLHRNAVGSRLQRFTELTGADLSDPEQRIALQLACRAAIARSNENDLR